MKFQKSKIQQQLESRIEQFQKDIEFDISQLMVGDISNKCLVFFKKLFGISHTPKYRTREEAEKYLEYKDTSSFKDVIEQMMHLALKEELEEMILLKEHLDECPEVMIELMDYQKDLIFGRKRYI